MKTIIKYTKDPVLLGTLYLLFAFIASDLNPLNWHTGVKIFAVVVFLLWLVGYLFRNDKPTAEPLELEGLRYDIDRIKEKLNMD